jgi:hypothetical protein
MSFGGSVKLEGESAYRKALSQITQELKVVSSEMKVTASSFDAGEKSTEEVTQASESLMSSLEQQRSALANVKAQLASMIEEYDKTAEANKKLNDQYDEEKAKLEEIGRTLGTSSEEYKDQQRAVEELAEEITRSERAYEAQGKAINDLKIKTANAETNINKTAIAIDKMGEEAEQSSSETDALGKATAQAGKDASSASDGFTVMKGVLANLATQVINACIDGMVNLGKSIVDTVNEVGQLGDEIDKESQKLGLSTDTYQELAYAMEMSGSSIDDVSRGMRNISSALAGVEDGVEGASEKFDALGVSLTNSDGTLKSQEEVLLESIDALASMESVTQRNAIANDIFGKSYTELAPLLNTGADGIEALMQEAQDYGMVMSKDAVNASANYDDALTRLNGTIQGVKNGVVGQFLPAITDLVNAFSALAIGSEDAGAQIDGAVGTIIQQFLDMIPDAVTTVQSIADVILQVAPSIIDALVNGIISALPSLTATATTIITSLLSSLLPQVPRILEVGLQAILQLLNGLKSGMPQVIAMLPSIITDIANTLISYAPQILSAGLELIKALGQGLIDAIPDLISQLPQILLSISDFFLSSIPEIISVGVELISSLANNADEIINNICDAIPYLIEGICNGFLDNLEPIIQAGVTLFVALLQNAPEISLKLCAKIPEIIYDICQAFISQIPKLMDVGKNLIEGLWQGILNAKDWLMGMIEGFCDDVVGAIEDLFEINSPSKRTKVLGGFLAQGLGVGFEDEMDSVSKDMERASEAVIRNLSDGLISAENESINQAVDGMLSDVIERAKEMTVPLKLWTSIGDSMSQGLDLGDVNAMQNLSVPTQNEVNTFDSMVTAFKDALSEMKIEMDDEEMGKFVDKTVTQLVYS